MLERKAFKGTKVRKNIEDLVTLVAERVIKAPMIRELSLQTS